MNYNLIDQILKNKNWSLEVRCTKNTTIIDLINEGDQQVIESYAAPNLEIGLKYLLNFFEMVTMD